MYKYMSSRDVRISPYLNALLDNIYFVNCRLKRYLQEAIHS